MPIVQKGLRTHTYTSHPASDQALDFSKLLAMVVQGSI